MAWFLTSVEHSMFINYNAPDLPDMYALSPRTSCPWALGIYVKQIPPVMLQPLLVIQ